MRRLLLALCAGSSLLITRPNLMIAQDRSYDEGALRLDAHHGTISIVRGTSGAVVGKIGVFRGTDLTSVVSPSPNAVAEAMTFQRDYRPGTLMLSAGIVTMGAALGASRIADSNSLVPMGLTIAGVALITYGGTKIESAYRALSKAIWWYNRDLNR